MASALKGLKDKHLNLTRYAVRAVARLQMLLDEEGTPEYLKPQLLACLDMLDRGLLAQDLEDERVVIEVAGGVARVVAKTDYVDVVIRYYGGEA